MLLVRPAEALRFGIVLGVVATLVLGFTVNWPSALLADAAILFYVFVYTLGLKRRTPSNIVIGGAAGCFPVLIGWSAVTGGVGWPAVVLFGVIFAWTPPHFWALAMKFRDDYAAAGVPMLPVVADATHRHAQDRRLLLPDGRRVVRARAGRPRRAALPRRRLWSSVRGSWSRRIGSRRARGPARTPSRCGCSTCRSRT